MAQAPHRNNIMEIILEKANKANKPSLIPFYKRKIQLHTNRSKQSLNDILNNRAQPKEREKPAIAKTLAVNIEKVFPEKAEQNDEDSVIQEQPENSQSHPNQKQ